MLIREHAEQGLACSILRALEGQLGIRARDRRDTHPPGAGTFYTNLVADGLNGVTQDVKADTDVTDSRRRKGSGRMTQTTPRSFKFLHPNRRTVSTNPQTRRPP